MENSICNQDVMNLFTNKKCLNIGAPMVRYSKLQFRTLLRRYNCDLCFTPMILADSFCQSEEARSNEFSTSIDDEPVIVQFAANTVHDFVGAADLVAPYCNGVDLNCGCPQRWAKAQGIGCVMLENPETIYDIIRQCRNHISKPFSLSVKMRLLPNLKQSVSICQQLEHCGVSFLTVHARTANQHSSGNVNIEALKLISDSVQCPVVANGGVKNLQDVLDMHEQTNCQGVMAASGLLTNPALFSGTNVTPLDCIQNWVDICYNSTIDNSVYSQNITNNFTGHKNNLTFQCFHHHLVFMLEKILAKKHRKVFNSLQNFESILQFLKEHFNVKPNLFTIEKNKLYSRLNLCYNNRNKTYLELKTVEDDDENDFDSSYDYNLTDGKFFNSKKHLDNSDTCISSLFLE